LKTKGAAVRNICFSRQQETAGLNNLLTQPSMSQMLSSYSDLF